MTKRVLIIVVLAAALPVASADVVYLKSGTQMEGKVTDMGDHIVLEMGTMRTTIAKDEIERIERKKAPLDEFQERLRALPEGNAQAFHELGLWCLSKKLSSHATAMFERAIALDPDHDPARRKLGYRRRGDEWVKSCYGCSAKGTTKCPTCRAMGFVRIVCPNNCVEGKKTCEPCAGRGFFVCQACQGIGFFGCGECGGTGSAYVGWPWGFGRCPACHGMGRLDCEVCMDGRIDCKECKKGLRKCRTCAGRGIVRLPCRKCDGEKYVSCATCSGRRYLTDEEILKPPSPRDTTQEQDIRSAQPNGKMLQPLEE